MNEQQIRKRNFYFMTIEGTFIFFGLTFVDSNSVIPVFIDAYTGSLQLAGLANTLRMVFMLLPQLLIGPFIPGVRDMAGLVTRLMLTFRPLFLLMVPVLLGGANSYVVVSIFLIIYSLFFISEGLLSIPWWEVFSRTIPNERRGKLLGYQQFFSGIVGIAGGFIIKLTLESPTFTNAVKYSIIFGIAGTLTTISAMVMIAVKDLPRTPSTEKVNLRAYFGQLPGYLNRNKDFISLCVVQVIGGFTGVLIPFTILFGKDTFNMDASQVSTLIYVQIIGTLIGGILWGSISHRLGNKYVIIISQAVGLSINVLAIASMSMKLSGIPYIMVLLGGIYMGSWLGIMNYLLEVVTEADRPVYLVLNSIITFPLTFFPYFAGLIADVWGFMPVFIIGAVAGTAAIVMGFIRLKSPRQLQ